MNKKVEIKIFIEKLITHIRAIGTSVTCDAGTF